MSIDGIGRTKTDFNNFTAPKSGWPKPDWEKIPHKGMPRPQEEEYDSIIDRLAKAAAEALKDKDDNKYRAIMAEVDKVREQFTSIVSPDRKAMHKEATTFIDGASKFLGRKNPDGRMPNIFDYLTEQGAKLKPAKDGQFSIELNSGTTITVTGNGFQPDMFDIKSAGTNQAVMGYSCGEWTYGLTPEEQARQTIFLTQFNNAEKQYRTTLPDLPDGRLDTKA